MDDLEALYRRHHHEVRRFALFLTGDPARADDLASETFVRAWMARDRIATASVRGYLMAIARNLHRDEWRRTARLRDLDEALPDAGPAVDERAGNALRLAGVRRQLARVAPGDRRALLLHAVRGWSYGEIAGHLGITLAAVKSRIFRARAALTRPPTPSRTGEPT
ncbi:MAG: RNA polymerase sigma factor [Vicinamibacterales bacterium]